MSSLPPPSLAVLAHVWMVFLYHLTHIASSVGHLAGDRMVNTVVFLWNCLQHICHAGLNNLLVLDSI